MKFYTYAWMREDNSPYYVGKGHGKRAYQKHARGLQPPGDLSRIVIQYWPDEATAFAYERYLIDFYGRKDLGTGCLRNLTDGGDGIAGLVCTEEHRRNIGNSSRGRIHSKESRRKIGDAFRGKKLGPYSEERRRAAAEAGRGKHVGNQANRGKKLSEEWRRNIGAASRKIDRSYMRSKEYRNAMSEAKSRRA